LPGMAPTPREQSSDVTFGHTAFPFSGTLTRCGSAACECRGLDLGGGTSIQAVHNQPRATPLISREGVRSQENPRRLRETRAKFSLRRA